jgi:putative ABC transport system substrate-binding protein
LVASKVDVILVAGAQATNAAKNATGAIPVVMVVGGGDPVASGFVASLSRPGGNITGQKIIIDDTLTGKRLELLKQIRPDISRVAVLVNRANVAHPAFLVQAVAAASALAINVQAVEVDVPAGLDEAFAIMAKGRAEALVYLEDAEVLSNVEQIVRRAVRVRLPTVHTQRNGVDAGGLMSYGPSIIDSYRNSAAFVDKILKGAKPGDLPIEQPTKFELVINMKAAKTLGLTIPPSLLSRADEVIQ